MKKKPQNKTNPDINDVMNKIQAQLAMLDRKLDAFMTKSLTELAQARAVQKPLQPVPYSPPPTTNRPNEQRPGRPMYAVVCFECGKDTEIPFKPSGDRPVYCKECFAKRKAGNFSKPTDPRPQMVVHPQQSAPASTSNQKTSVNNKKTFVAKKSVGKKKIVSKKTSKRK